MGLTGDDLRNATIIPAGCVFVIGLSVLTCCCLRCKNRNEELERRLGSTQTPSNINHGDRLRNFSETSFHGIETADETMRSSSNQMHNIKDSCSQQHTPNVSSVEYASIPPYGAYCGPTPSFEVEIDNHH